MKSISRLFQCAGVFICLFCAANSVNGQSVSADISANSLRAGDTVIFSITLMQDQSYDEIIFPDSSRFNQNFELRSRRRYRVSDFKDSVAYQLQFWGVDDATISALPVKLVSGADTATLYTQPVSVGFNSVIQTENPELRPLKPIFAFARAWWFYLLILLLLVAAAAAGWYYYKKRQEQTEPEPAAEFEPEPFLNPLRELENNLNRLENVLEDEELNYKQFYIDLGDAIRLYFEQMYRISALEMTSGEILRELNKRVIDERIVRDTRIVLNEADMVKFAKFKPTREQARKAFGKAEDFHSTVKEQHRSRMQHMRRQHFERVEQKRRAFNEAQKQKETA